MNCIYPLLRYRQTIFSVLVTLWMFHSAYSQSESQQENSAETDLEVLDIDAVDILDALRLLSEISGMNLVVTEEAKEEKVTLYLKNITALEALDTICKVTGLWYRHDPKSDVYRVMTTDEYKKDLVVHQDYEIKIFQLFYPNADSIATEIEDLFGDRVLLSIEEGVFDFTEVEDLDSRSGSGFSGGGGGGGRGRGRSSSRGGGRFSSRGGAFSSRDASELTIPQHAELSVGQIEYLESLQSAQLQDELATSKKPEGTELLAIGVQDPLIYVTVNREHNLIIIRTTDRVALRQIASFIEDVDRPIPQVLLEMKILELRVGNDFKSIFDYDFASTNTEQGPATDQVRNPLSPDSELGVENVLGLGGFPLESNTLVYQFMNDNIIARIQLLAEDQKLNVLATPMLISVNNREAEIVIGEERVLTTGASSDIQTGTNVNVTTISAETEIRNIGTTLRIIPRINADRTVILHIEQDSSTVLPNATTIPISTGTGAVTEFPVDSVDTRNLEATVVAKDGLTVAVGGLIRTSISDNIQKVPMLGELPLIGRMFRREVEAHVKTELVLLITPHIMTSPEEAEVASYDRIDDLSSHSYHELGQEAFDNQIKILNEKQQEKEIERLVEEWKAKEEAITDEKR